VSFKNRTFGKEKKTPTLRGPEVLCGASPLNLIYLREKQRGERGNPGVFHLKKERTSGQREASLVMSRAYGEVKEVWITLESRREKKSVKIIVAYTAF